MIKAAALLLTALVLGSPAWAAPVVSIPQGKLAGTEYDGVAAFRAIPYAAPPIGALRWRAPAAAKPWRGVRPAGAFGPVCPQAPVNWAGHDLDRTSEDCLTLNIWTPSRPATAGLPVMVWYHGGAYTAGSGSQGTYEGTKLARRGAVIVTVNYRLGALGYLAHPALSAETPQHVSGNYGLLDQIAALKWVRANIARFGGNPHNVTIFGQSAGGGSTMLLTVSPLARGLFQKAIFESGAALKLPNARDGAGPNLQQAEQAGSAFAGKLGASGAAQLRALPVAALIDPSVPRISTSPIIDGKVVPSDITAAYRAVRDAGVPTLLGWNTNEAAHFVGSETRASYAASINEAYGSVAPKLLQLYPARDDADATRAAIELISDGDFGWRGWSIAQARLAKGAAPVFVYQFDNPPPSSDGRRTEGAVHSDELRYVWGNDDPAGTWPDTDKALEATVQTYWVNFARTGNPNAAGLPEWAPYRAARTALWFSGGKAHSQGVLRGDKLQLMDRALRDAGR